MNRLLKIILLIILGVLVVKAFSGLDCILSWIRTGSVLDWASIESCGF